jgi:hypothetical protein
MDPRVVGFGTHGYRDWQAVASGKTRNRRSDDDGEGELKEKGFHQFVFLSCLN